MHCWFIKTTLQCSGCVISPTIRRWPRRQMCSPVLADPYTRETAQILGRQVVTMPNSIRSFELPTAPKTNKIVVLSRLDEAKHLDRLIQAFAQVQGQVKESWQLVIYGEGPSRESLEALVADLHLSDRVSLPGSCYDLTKAFSGASYPL